MHPDRAAGERTRFSRRVRNTGALNAEYGARRHPVPFDPRKETAPWRAP